MLTVAKSNQKAVYGICASFLIALAAIFGLGHNLSHVLQLWLLVAVVALLFVAALHLLGNRKDTHFGRGMLTRSIAIELICYGLIIYLLGAFLGFNRGYSLNSSQSFFANFLPTLLLIIGIELLRFIIVAPLHKNKLSVVFLTTLTSLTYLLIELSVVFPTNSEQLFVFICVTLIPILAHETLSSFITYRIGLLPDLVYRLALFLYPYLLPIVPNLGDYLYAVSGVVLPFIIFLSTNKYSIVDEQNRRGAKINFKFAIGFMLVLIAILASLTSGIFKHQLIAVASDSMVPTFARGDAVLIEKLSASEIENGDILVFRRDGRIITHRVMSVELRDGTYYFTTRGDANADPDSSEASDQQVVGRVRLVGKYIGYPTVLLSEIFNKGQ